MKKLGNKKKVISILLVMSMCFLLSVSIFATNTFAQTIEEYSNLESTMSSEEEFSSRSLLSAANALGYTVTLSSTPQYYQFDINIMKISRPTTMTFTMTNVRTRDNKKISEYKKVITVNKLGRQSFKWYLPISSTVEERMTCNLSWSNLFSRGSETGTIIRMNTDGGAYNKLLALDGHRHHIPSQAALKDNNINTNTAPAIRMTVADHKRTATYGNTLKSKTFVLQEKILLKQGKFLVAQALGIKDVKMLFPGSTKYDKALEKMVSYTRSLGYKK